MGSLAAKVRPHLRNAGWSSAEYVFYPLLMLVATPVFIATLGTADFGLLMFVSAITGLGSAGSLGMGAATIKFVSSALGRGDRAEAAESVRATLAVTLLGTTAVAVAIAIARPWLAHTVFPQMGAAEKVSMAILFAAAMLVITQADGIFGAALRGMERFGIAARLEIAFKLLAIGAGMTVAWLTRDVIAVLLTSALFSSASALAKGAMVGRLAGVPWLLPRLKNRALARGVLTFGSWSWISAMGGLLFVHADRLLIGALLGAHAVAYYSACTQLAQQIHALPAAAMAFLFPLMSRTAHTADERALGRVRDYGVAGGLGMSVVLGAIMLLFGPALLVLWMGASFAAQTGNVLPWLTVAYFLLSLNVAPHYLLLGRNEARYVALVGIAGGAIGIAAAFVLIPASGLEGAAQARIVLGLTTLAYYWKVYRVRPRDDRSYTAVA